MARLWELRSLFFYYDKIGFIELLQVTLTVSLSFQAYNAVGNRIVRNNIEGGFVLKNLNLYWQLRWKCIFRRKLRSKIPPFLFIYSSKWIIKVLGYFISNQRSMNFKNSQSLCLRNVISKTAKLNFNSWIRINCFICINDSSDQKIL